MVAQTPTHHGHLRRRASGLEGGWLCARCCPGLCLWTLHGWLTPVILGGGRTAETHLPRGKLAGLAAVGQCDGRDSPLCHMQ